MSQIADILPKTPFTLEAPRWRDGPCRVLDAAGEVVIGNVDALNGQYIVFACNQTAEQADAAGSDRRAARA